jgi:hypothetical protein
VFERTGVVSVHIIILQSQYSGDGPTLNDSFDCAVIWTRQEGDESYPSVGWQWSFLLI